MYCTLTLAVVNGYKQKLIRRYYYTYMCNINLKGWHDIEARNSLKI